MLKAKGSFKMNILILLIIFIEEVLSQDLCGTIQQTSESISPGFIFLTAAAVIGIAFTPPL
jgi:hypothetical protein